MAKYWGKTLERIEKSHYRSIKMAAKRFDDFEKSGMVVSKSNFSLNIKKLILDLENLSSFSAELKDIILIKAVKWLDLNDTSREYRLKGNSIENITEYEKFLQSEEYINKGLFGFEYLLTQKISKQEKYDFVVKSGKEFKKFFKEQLS